MALIDIAPRLGKAHDQMQEIERVLGWVRDHSWTGGFDVVVDARHYWCGSATEHVSLTRVMSGATPFPIRGFYKVNVVDSRTSLIGFDSTGQEVVHRVDEQAVKRIPGQWAMWEVQKIIFWQDSPPHELFAESYPDFPYPTPTLNKED